MDVRSLFSLEIISEWLDGEGYIIGDLGLLASCLERPWLIFGAVPLYPTPFDKAAAVLDSVTRNHPLVDGNKRLRVLLASLMLRAHGVDDRMITDDAWFELSMAVISDHLPVEDIARNLRGHCGA